FAGMKLKAEDIGDGGEDELWRVQRLKRDKIYIIIKLVGAIGRYPDRQPRFADATRADQRQQATIGVIQLMRDLANLTDAIEKGCCGMGQIMDDHRASAF